MISVTPWVLNLLSYKGTLKELKNDLKHKRRFYGSIKH